VQPLRNLQPSPRWRVTRRNRPLVNSEDRTGRLPASLPRSARARAGAALARLPAARLLNTDGHERDERHATWLELFFDLVFVAAIAQLAAKLGGQPSAVSLVRFAGLFVVIWWVWVTFSTHFDRFGTEDPFNCVAALVAMLLAVGLAASIPGVFADRTAPFAIAYALLKGEQLLLFERARRQVPAIRPLYARFVLVGLFSVGCWLASMALIGSSRYLLWAAAILAELATPWLSIGAARPAPLNVSHLPERFGTFVLIVLGESVARLVTAAAQRPWTIPLCVVLAAAFTTIAAMWWISFNAIDHAAVGRGRLATLGYIYTQLPMVAGIAAASAGLHRAILAAAGAGPIATAPRAALYGGVALYLFAASATPASTARRRARRIRLAAALAAFALIFMGAVVAPEYLVPALTLILAGEIALDTPRHKTPRNRAAQDDHGGAAAAQARTSSVAVGAAACESGSLVRN
jgi:low temperature requirement protein LtrA